MQEMQTDRADGITLYSLQSGATKNQIGDILCLYTSSLIGFIHRMQPGSTEIYNK